MWLASRRRATDFSERARGGVHRGCTDRIGHQSANNQAARRPFPLIWNSIEASLCCFQLFQEGREPPSSCEGSARALGATMAEAFLDNKKVRLLRPSTPRSLCTSHGACVIVRSAEVVTQRRVWDALRGFEWSGEQTERE